jgi:hypothetical protein
MLSERDVDRLTSAVSLWLERGVLPFAITFALSDDLPPDLRHPAGLVAYRLRELLPAPVPAPAPVPLLASAQAPPPASGPRPDMPGDRPRPHPIQVCVRCDSISFRAPEPGLCNPCKREEKDAASSNPDNDWVGKMRDYPLMGVPVYVIFDPRDGTGAVMSDVHSTPDGPRYATRKDFVYGEDVTIAEWTISTAGLPRYADSSPGQ